MGGSSELPKYSRPMLNFPLEIGNSCVFAYY
jgi:hypothetical protein